MAPSRPIPTDSRIDDRRVCDVLRVPAFTALPEETIEVIERRLEAIGAHHLLVTVDKTLHGVVCSCDLVSGAPATPVRKVMTTEPVIIDPRATISLAAAAMDHHDVNCLPSFWQGSWKLITRGDLVRLGAAERRICVACGGHHHVRPRTADGTSWCRDCYDPRFSLDDVAKLYRDIGVPG